MPAPSIATVLHAEHLNRKFTHQSAVERHRLNILAQRGAAQAQLREKESTIARHRAPQSDADWMNRQFKIFHDAIDRTTPGSSTAADFGIEIRKIQNVVAESYGVTRADLLSARRTLEVVIPRQVAAYLAKVMTPRSFPDIGRRFGGRDHTTVLHAFRKIERLIKTDPVLADRIETLKAAITS